MGKYKDYMMNFRSPSFFRKIKRAFRQPFFLLLQGLLNKIPFQPLRMACFYILLLDQAPELPLAEARVGEVRLAGPENIQELIQCENKPECFLRRFQAGDLCFMVQVDGKIAGYEWFSDAPIHLEERYRYQVDIPSDKLYAYDAYIIPEYRHRGLWLQVVEQSILFLDQIERKRELALIDHENQRSLQLHRRLGFYPDKKVFYFSLFGMTFFKETKIKEAPHNQTTV